MTVGQFSLVGVCLLLASQLLIVHGVNLRGSDSEKLQSNPTGSKGRVRSRTAPSASDTPDVTLETCQYNLFLSNTHGLGFAGGKVLIKSAFIGQTPTYQADVTLQEHMIQSGWSFTVYEGQTVHLSYTYTKSDVQPRENEMWVTDANGVTVLHATNMTTEAHHLTSSVNVSCACRHQETNCPSLRVRHEWRSLSYCDKRNFINALQTMKTVSGNSSLYDDFSIHHRWASDAITPFTALPWHRAFILAFENTIRGLGGKYSCISLPYWDWSLDFGSENTSDIYAELGGLKLNSCLQSPFDSWTNPHTGLCVSRRMASATQANPNAAYIPLSVAWQGMTTNSSLPYPMRFLLRYAHTTVHTEVGGVTGDIATKYSSIDPLFWMHHANLDRLWALWQDCFDYDTAAVREASLSACVASGGCVGLNDAMPAVTQTPKQVLDINELHYRYTPVDREWVNYDLAGQAHGKCNWNWFAPEQYASTALGSSAVTSLPIYRVNVHNDEQRARLTTAYRQYKSKLSGGSTHPEALRAAIAMECKMGNGAAKDVILTQLTQQFTNIHFCKDFMCKNPCKMIESGWYSEVEYY